MRTWKPWAAALSGLVLLSFYALAMSRDRPDLNSRSTWLQRSMSLAERRGDEIQTTRVPYRLPLYLWDAEVRGGEEVDLAPLVSGEARTSAGVLRDAAFRIKLGEPDRPGTLEVSWASDPDSRFRMELYDNLSRPLGRWTGSEGSTDPLMLQGGVYRLVLSAEGALGGEFRLVARGQASESFQSDIQGRDIGPADVPTIQIQMSPANFGVWESMRREAYQALSPLGAPVEIPNRKVTARLTVDGAVSQARVWLAGQGAQGHADPRGPSFTVRLRAGPLVRGLSRFKLYNIRTQTGLLDYVVASILEDEGIFVPRKLLANVTLNGRDLGLYVVEEVAKTQGHFESHRRYDGQITANGKLYADLSGVWTRKQPLTNGEEFSQAFASTVEPGKFAKALALASRFYLTHGIEEGDIRFYRSALLESPEPWLRDIGAGSWSQHLGGYAGLLAHAGWWLRPQLISRGAVTNPKPYPPIPGLPTGQEHYQFGPATTAFSSVHPLVWHFVADPELRPIFDRFVFYTSDPSFQRRFAGRLRATLAAVRPFLKDAGLKRWITNQVAHYSRNELIVPRATRAFMETSRLLARVEPGTARGDGTAPQRVVTLYNLSPFSARLRLPEFVRRACDGGAGERLQADSLAPSQIFLSVVPHFGADALGGLQGALEGWAPSPTVMDRLLALESVRFRSRDEENERFAPMIRILVPSERMAEFLQWLETHSAVSLGGVHPLPARRNVIVPGASPPDRPDMAASLGRTPETWGLPPGTLDDPDVLVYMTDTAESEGGTRITYLVSNFSARPVDLDLERLAVIEVGQGKADADLESVWWLDREARVARESNLTLGAATQAPDPGGPRLPSPWLWPGGVTAFFRGPVDPARPNVALVEVLVRGCGLVFTDAESLAVFPDRETRVQVLALEPVWTSCISSVARTPVAIHPRPRAVLSSVDSAAGQRPLRPTREDITTYDTLMALQAGHPSPWTAAAAFDDNAWTYWRPTPPALAGQSWLAMDFGEETDIGAMEILPGPGDPAAEGSLTDRIVLQGSNDGIEGGSWTALRLSETRLPRPDGPDRVWIGLSLPDRESYRYYRLVGATPSDLSIRELRFEVEGGPVLYRETVPVERLVRAGLLVPEESSRDEGPTVLRPTVRELQIMDLVEIPDGTVLELPAGSVLRFGPEAGLLSYGSIRALGTADAPVRLLPDSPEAGFLGIAVVNAETQSVFEHVEMAGGRGGFFGPHQISGGLSFYRTSVRIANSHLHDLPANDGLHLSRADFTIEDSRIEATASDAIDIDWSFGEIAGSSFERCGRDSGDCLDISGSRIELRDIRIDRASDKGISIGEGSIVEIENLRVSDSRIAVAVKDGSVVRIDDCTLTRNEYGLLRYVKKPIYPYPDLIETGCRFTDNAVARLDEPAFIWTRRYD